MNYLPTGILTIQAKKSRNFKIPIFDKSWINYKRSTRTLVIKCQSERLMNKGARTQYYQENLIIITTERAAYVSIDDNLFDFSYELESKNFCGSLTIGIKYAELYQAEKGKAKTQLILA